MPNGVMTTNSYEVVPGQQGDDAGSKSSEGLLLLLTKEAFEALRDVLALVGFAAVVWGWLWIAGGR